MPLARALEDAEFSPGDRAAIIMTNQSKWLISAYAIFHGGGVLVPLDYKLTAAEHLQLLAHSKAKFLVIEYYLWRAIMQVAGVQRPQSADCSGYRSAAGSGSGGRVPLGRVSPQRRSGVCSAPASGRGLHRLFLGHRRTVPRDACSPMRIIWNSARR